MPKNPPPFSPPTTTALLNTVRVVSQINVDSHVWTNATFHIQDHIFEQLICGLEVKLLEQRFPTEQIKETRFVVTETPATWWEHLKLEKAGHRAWFWLRWFKQPLMTRTTEEITVEVDLTRIARYPHAKPVNAEWLGVPVWDYEYNVVGDGHHGLESL